MTSANELANQSCIPCRGGVPPLTGEALKKLLKQLGNGWELKQEHHLEKDYRFQSYMQGIDFTHHVAELAEAQGHHPIIEIGYQTVKLKIWTHKIDGLTESDFILAAKADKIKA